MMKKIKLTKKQKIKIARIATMFGYALSVGVLSAAENLIGYECGYEDAMKEVKR